MAQKPSKIPKSPFPTKSQFNAQQQKICDENYRTELERQKTSEWVTRTLPKKPIFNLLILKNYEI
jgi:hypothetical protein